MFLVCLYVYPVRTRVGALQCASSLPFFADIVFGVLQSVRMVPFEEAEGSLPSYDPECDLVVFPSEGSVCWSDLPPEDLAAVRRIILIDSRRGSISYRGWLGGGRVVYFVGGRCFVHTLCRSFSNALFLADSLMKLLGCRSTNSPTFQTSVNVTLYRIY